MNDAHSSVTLSHMVLNAESVFVRKNVARMVLMLSASSAHEQETSLMTVYVIVQLKMTNREAYDRYQARFFDVFKKFNGRLLSADEHPAVLEGTWDRDKLVLMSFPDEAAFRAWADSPDYLEISKDRKAGAEGIVLLAKGFSL
jgi:uncharacterized protein (DUF1330 family)